MGTPASLATLVGSWVGTNRLWLSPGEPVHESEATALVALAAHGYFVTIQYTWADEGEPQDGLLVLGYDTQLKAVTAVWIDSWHMRDKYMLCQGAGGAEGVVSVKGSYAAPPGPDWGWWIAFEPRERDAFRIVMHNVSPDGKAELAVEAAYARQR